jgi:hypothetical protein
MSVDGFEFAARTRRGVINTLIGNHARSKRNIDANEKDWNWR